MFWLWVVRHAEMFAGPGRKPRKALAGVGLFGLVLVHRA